MTAAERHREAARRRWLVAGVALALALALVLWRGVDWLSAFGALGLLAATALVALGRSEAPAREAGLGTQASLGLTSLTVEGLISALPAPAFLVDPDLVVRSHNERALGLVPGLRRGEPLTLALRAPDVVEAVRRAAASNQPQAIDHAERVPVSRWYRVEAAPVIVTARARDEGRPDYVLVSLRDLTEERRLERLRADFVANASHELRTPLASVVGFIETIQGPARNDPAARERFLAIMLAQAQRMARLIDDLLSLSRVELNEHVRPTGTVDLVRLIGQVRDALGPYAEAQGVDVGIVTEHDRLAVQGDQDELFRLFENLVQNAVKYGADGKRVDIRLTREPARREVAVAVRDFGAGIPPEHLPRLTERFYRADVATSRDKGGTGLGLALAKHIVNRHRGRLVIESEPGKGATFTVRLAALEEAAPPDARRDAAE